MAEITKFAQAATCNFCAKGRSEVAKLIVANDVGICDECIELCGNILNKEKNEQLRKDKKIGGALDPVKVKKYLDHHIVGQAAAKKTLSVAVVNHYKRIYFKPQTEIEKSNILIFGPTGSGKTLMARRIAKYLKVPFVIADATTLTEAGYVGEDVESLISRLLAEAEYNVELCEQGIVFIDEIDKISRKSENPLVRDVSGEGVQQALLKLVEGTKCRVTVGANKKNVVMDSVEIDTKNILFIAAGAFSELDKIISDRNNQSSKMGFTSTIDKQIVDRKQVQQADFVKYGLIQEFTGRFPIITHVDNLTLDDMISVLTEPKHNLIKQMQFYFNIDNIELTFTEQAVRIIAEQALAMKSGARALKSILETILEPYLFDIETIKKDYKAIEITADTILNSSPAIFHKK
jgi:ATP-dependent Clp protease ATP-binding subunit ClpX